MTTCENKIIERGKGTFLPILGVTKTKVYHQPHVALKKVLTISEGNCFEKYRDAHYLLYTTFGNYVALLGAV